MSNCQHQPLTANITMIYITLLVNILVCLTSAVDGYSIPRAISALFADVEENEVRENRFSLNTPEYFANAERFSDLVKRSHLVSKRVSQTPVCLGSTTDASFTKYDSQCSFSVTPSEYCCQVFAEQACADPAMPLVASVAIVRERTSGLGGAADAFLYDTCLTNSCSASCSLSEGNDAACKQCSYTCQRMCLANLQRQCMSRVCGQNWVSLSTHAMNFSPKSRNYALHEKAESEVQQRMRIARSDLEKIEQAQVIKSALNVLEKNMDVPMCTPTELIAADRSAGVFVNAAGITYSEAILGCTSNILTPSMVPYILENPSVLANSDTCSIVSTCERNHMQLALDRSASEIARRSKVSTKLSEP